MAGPFPPCRDAVNGHRSAGAPHHTLLLRLLTPLLPLPTVSEAQRFRAVQTFADTVVLERTFQCEGLTCNVMDLDVARS
jgi:hypothetical protein